MGGRYANGSQRSAFYQLTGSNGSRILILYGHVAQSRERFTHQTTVDFLSQKHYLVLDPLGGMDNNTNMVACSYRMGMLWVLTLVLGCTLTVHAQFPSFWGCPEKNIPMPDFDLSKVSMLNQRKVKSKPVATKFTKCYTKSAF